MAEREFYWMGKPDEEIFATFPQPTAKNYPDWKSGLKALADFYRTDEMGTMRLVAVGMRQHNLRDSISGLFREIQVALAIRELGGIVSQLPELTPTLGV